MLFLKSSFGVIFLLSIILWSCGCFWGIFYWRSIDSVQDSSSFLVVVFLIRSFLLMFERVWSSKIIWDTSGFRLFWFISWSLATISFHLFISTSASLLSFFSKFYSLVDNFWEDSICCSSSTYSLSSLTIFSSKPSSLLSF